jgi:hypothetical protein
LSAWGKPYAPPTNVPVNSTVDVRTTPPDQVARMDAGAFFKRLALAMKDNPAYAADGAALEKLTKLGIEPGKDFDIAKVDPAITRGLQRAVKAVHNKMQEGVNRMETVNGWLQPTDIGRYGTDYDTRAGITLVGLGANMPDDTIYPTAYVDGDDKPLDSVNKYILHYERGSLQPTNATWSISQYKGNFYEHNVLERYAIAPWMPLKFNADGSLDIYLQANSPGSEKEANWLPTPAGQFNITIRNYFPQRSALDGTYKNPPIQRVQP